MKIKENIKRFCFATAINQSKQYELILAIKSIDKNKFGIENSSLFENETFAFVILDVNYQFDLTTLSKHLNNQKGASIKTGSKEDLIYSKSFQPLERVFKMKPEEYLTIKDSQDDQRFVMTLELKEDKTLLNTYKEIHRSGNMWPEIIDNMQTVGVTDMEIVLDGYQAFLIMDTKSTFDLEKQGEIWSKLPREREWQEYVANFQKTDPKSNAAEKWKIIAKTSTK